MMATSHTHTRIHTCVYVCACVCLHVWACLCVCLCVYACQSDKIMYMCVSEQTYVYIFVCMCVWRACVYVRARAFPNTEYKIMRVEAGAPWQKATLKRHLQDCRLQGSLPLPLQITGVSSSSSPYTLLRLPSAAPFPLSSCFLLWFIHVLQNPLREVRFGGFCKRRAELPVSLHAARNTAV
jgi:hypothetical protein